MALPVDRDGRGPESTGRWTLVRTVEDEFWRLDRGYPDYARLWETIVSRVGY